VSEVTTGELADALEQGAVVIDCREPDEWAAAHIEGTRLLPVSEFQRRWREIPRNAGTVYIVCASVSRIVRVAEALRKAGVQAVNVTGGLKSWAEEGRPLEAGT
jgi:rhodanese-related sulfurtransferase